MATYYYFDIETYSAEAKPNPQADKVITIQFQQIDERTGKPKSELVILKEWESSEEAILKDFISIFHPWRFIPVGNNLNFERIFLKAKCQQYKIGDLDKYGDLAYNFPSIDIQALFVILNDGQFKGCGMHNFTKKKMDGSHIAGWYANKEYGKIEVYIKNETEAFLEFYQKCYSELPRVFVKKDPTT